MNEFMDEYGKIFQIHLNKKKTDTEKTFAFTIGPNPWNTRF